MILTGLFDLLMGNVQTVKTKQTGQTFPNPTSQLNAANPTKIRFSQYMMEFIGKENSLIT